jgi:hypothetical protein
LATAVSDTFSFSTLEGPAGAPPELCDLCELQVAAFAYTVTSADPGFLASRGRCCLTCGQNLLASLDQVRKQRILGGSKKAKTIAGL